MPHDAGQSALLGPFRLNAPPLEGFQHLVDGVAHMRIEDDPVVKVQALIHLSAHSFHALAQLLDHISLALPPTRMVFAVHLLEYLVPSPEVIEHDANEQLSLGSGTAFSDELVDPRFAIFATPNLRRQPLVTTALEVQLALKLFAYEILQEELFLNCDAQASGDMPRAGPGFLVGHHIVAFLPGLVFLKALPRGVQIGTRFRRREGLAFGGGVIRPLGRCTNVRIPGGSVRDVGNLVLFAQDMLVQHALPIKQVLLADNVVHGVQGNLPE
mmetsp:Transcript_67873/g.189499  ORF Transcript_67873/g.189499 Transcript_67873/m.189499 type:complete len:270 (+) Transcript_67873:571-1380(+)